MSYDTVTKKFTGAPAIGVTCWCSIQFAIPAALFDYYERANEARPDSVGLYCPLGHSFVPAGKSTSQREVERLRDELAREKHRTEQARADAEYHQGRERVARRQIAAKKGLLTKIKNRVGKGVCPCCNRYFADLHRHMSGQHPDWTPELDAADLSQPVAADWRALAARRELLGLDVEAVAAALHIAPNSLRIYERGKTISLSSAQRCAAYLNSETERRAAENVTPTESNP